jgi:hypothetical protein
MQWFFRNDDAGCVSFAEWASNYGISDLGASRNNVEKLESLLGFRHVGGHFAE